MSDCAVLSHEILIIHDQQQYRINNTENRRDESPAEDQVQYPRADTAEVELVKPETAQEKGKQNGSKFAFAVWG
jgi:hypothetical protein